MRSTTPAPGSEEGPAAAPEGRLAAWLRPSAMVLLLVVAAAFFLRSVNDHYPIAEWLFFRYAKYWAFAASFCLGCFAAGLRLLDWLLPATPRLGERWTLGFALGVLLFALGLFVAGLFGLLGPAFFVVWPVVLLVLGGRRLWRELACLRRYYRRFGFALVLPRGPAEALAAILLLAGTVAIYLQVITPRNVGYDAGWYHLPMAQYYASTGAIRPFAEGWYLGAYPQLASLLYTWAFLAPGDLFDHQALACHLEWALFLFTLGAMAPLVRHLLHGRRAPFAAAAIFLFPGIFLYDSNLNCGADHVLAFWAPALALALLRFHRCYAWREAVLAGALTAAALLTKFHGAYLLLPALLFTLVRAIRSRCLWPAFAWCGAALVLSSPYWLKNWIAHGDPMYPLLHAFVDSRPFHPGAARLLEQAYWVPRFELAGTAGEKALATGKALFTFSFVPHDWASFHGDKPVFGSLFTLTLPVLLILRKTRRIWLLVAGVHLGLLVWFVTSHQDRFLQALLPWMAACTAAVLVKAWHEGLLVRAALAALVAVQIVWGGDIYFFRTHSMVNDSPIRALAEHLGAGHRKEYAGRFSLFADNQQLGKALAPEATLLMHRERNRNGIAAASVVDEPGWQGAIDYLSLGSAERTLALWQQLGITHVSWRPDLGDMSPEDLAREAVFASAVRRGRAEPPRAVGGRQLAKLGAAKPPADGPALRIAWLGCGGDPPVGIYDAPGLAIRVPAATRDGEKLKANPARELAGVGALVLRPSCDYAAAARPAIAKDFEHVATAGDVSLWVRR